MPSTSKLSLFLQLYFLDGCFACDSKRRNSIKKIFKKSLSLKIYTEYFTSCALDAVTIGTTPITLDDDISDGSGISSPKQSRILKYDKSKAKKNLFLAPIASLVKQSDTCPNGSTTSSLVYPTGKSVILNRHEFSRKRFLSI